MFNKFKPCLILLQFAFLLIFSGCSKEDSPSSEELMVKASWKFSKATASGADVSSLVPVCYKDNEVTFLTASPANTGTVNEGATKCNAVDPQTISFTWTYDAGFRKITITGVSGSVVLIPGGSNEFNLVSVSETQMVLSQNVTFGVITQLVEVTLVH